MLTKLNVQGREIGQNKKKPNMCTTSFGGQKLENIQPASSGLVSKNTVSFQSLYK